MGANPGVGNPGLIPPPLTQLIKLLLFVRSIQIRLD